MGSIEKDIALNSMRMGLPLPDRIENAPFLQQGLQLYIDAFFELDSERSHGMGLTPISWSSLKSYAEFYKFDEIQTENLFVFIRKMDIAHLNRLEKKQPK